MDDAMDEYPSGPCCGTWIFLDESWRMPWMINQSDHVALQRFSWMMPWMSVQDDHVPVHASSWMNRG